MSPPVISPRFGNQPSILWRDLLCIPLFRRDVIHRRINSWDLTGLCHCRWSDLSAFLVIFSWEDDHLLYCNWTMACKNNCKSARNNLSNCTPAPLLESATFKLAEQKSDAKWFHYSNIVIGNQAVTLGDHWSPNHSDCPLRDKAIVVDLRSLDI